VEALRLVVSWVAFAIVTLLAVAVFRDLYKRRIDLKDVIADKDGDASMGRFQLLIFTFVIALSFVYVITSPGSSGFPEVPGSVLTLLGISGSSFLVSKTVDKAA
jgi:hypothetical protein